MEAMSVEQRLERLEKLAITGPAICPDPTGEGGTWQGDDVKIPVRGAWEGEAVRVPVGWLLHYPECGHNKMARVTKSNKGSEVEIIPSPYFPWGEEYEAILPDEAREDDEYWSADRWWKSGGNDFHPRAPGCFAWRRRKSPAEPAHGSDAEHPPLGYRLEPRGGERRRGYLWWHPDRREWIPCTVCVGLKVANDIIANPIPANEGGSQKAESGEMQKKLDIQWEAAKALEQERNALIAERAELRATVEHLTAENAELHGIITRQAEVIAAGQLLINEQTLFVAKMREAAG